MSCAGRECQISLPIGSFGPNPLVDLLGIRHPAYQSQGPFQYVWNRVAPEVSNCSTARNKTPCSPEGLPHSAICPTFEPALLEILLSASRDIVGQGFRGGQSHMRVAGGSIWYALV